MTQNVRPYASYHHIPRGTQLSTIKHMQSSKLDQLNAQHQFITKLHSTTLRLVGWLYVKWVTHVTMMCNALLGMKYVRAYFKTKRETFYWHVRIWTGCYSYQNLEPHGLYNSEYALRQNRSKHVQIFLTGYIHFMEGTDCQTDRNTEDVFLSWPELYSWKRHLVHWNT